MIYVYESCVPTFTSSTKKTQIVQTSRIDFTTLPGNIFKDSVGGCWTYLGEFQDGYVSPDSTFSITYSGDFFSSSVEILYPNCDECEITNVSVCNVVYFQGEKCSDSTTVYLKVCDVTPINTNVKVLPTIGQIVGVRNPNGDDFCVTIKSKIDFVEGALQISTPAWKDYTCDNCPIYKVYTANSCDGTETNVKLYQNYKLNTLPTYTSVRVDINYDCYSIISYDGIFCEYNFKSGETPEIIQIFSSCEACEINNSITNP
jgi:hypothetical protein